MTKLYFLLQFVFKQQYTYITTIAHLAIEKRGVLKP